jgi:hypothetical protein
MGQGHLSLQHHILVSALSVVLNLGSCTGPTVSDVAVSKGLWQKPGKTPDIDTTDGPGDGLVTAIPIQAEECEFGVTGCVGC